MKLATSLRRENLVNKGVRYRLSIHSMDDLEANRATPDSRSAYNDPLRRLSFVAPACRHALTDYPSVHHQEGSNGVYAGAFD